MSEDERKRFDEVNKKIVDQVKRELDRMYSAPYNLQEATLAYTRVIEVCAQRIEERPERLLEEPDEKSNSSQ